MNSSVKEEKRSTMAEIVEQLQEREAAQVCFLVYSSLFKLKFNLTKADTVPMDIHMDCCQPALPPGPWRGSPPP